MPMWLVQQHDHVRACALQAVSCGREHVVYRLTVTLCCTSASGMPHEAREAESTGAVHHHADDAGPRPERVKLTGLTDVV